MSIGASIVLIAVGAILRFAVSLRSSFAGASVNWHIVGDILMAVGIVGLVISLIWMATLSRRNQYAAEDRYDAGPPREPRAMP
jgi:uncharacterized membrane protein YidH (DUF202 family)